MTDEETASALVACGEALYEQSTTNTGAAWRLAHRMHDARPGALVLVEHVRHGTPALDRVGHLLRDDVRPPEGDAPRGPRVWTIRTLDGREVEWDNVLILALPEKPWTV